jgi:hypothetical protein
LDKGRYGTAALWTPDCDGIVTIEHDLTRISAGLRDHPKPVRQRPKKSQKKNVEYPTETEMNSTKTKITQSTQSVRREVQNLEVRYGNIGISAVAAAMRYQGYAKKPALVSADRQPDRWLKDMVPEIAA